MSQCPVILTCSALLLAGAAAVSCRPTIALADPPAAGAESTGTQAESARTQAEIATDGESRMVTFPARNTAVACSMSGRAFAQSPPGRWTLPAAKWARPTV